MKAHNTYSTTMFKPALLRATIAALAEKLPGLQKRYDFDTIAVTGKSGMALGFALSMCTGINVVAVRKGESSHGDVIEGGGNEFERYAFFDDCIASGETVRRVENELGRYADARNVARPTRSLCILYNNGADHADELYDGKYGPTFSLRYRSHLGGDYPYLNLAAKAAERINKAHRPTFDALYDPDAKMTLDYLSL